MPICMCEGVDAKWVNECGGVAEEDDRVYRPATQTCRTREGEFEGERRTRWVR